MNVNPKLVPADTARPEPVREAAPCDPVLCTVPLSLPLY